MSLALDILTVLAVSAGAFFFMAGTVGLLRFRDALSRLHGLTKADNRGERVACGNGPGGHAEDQEGETDIESQGNPSTWAGRPAGRCAQSAR